MHKGKGKERPSTKTFKIEGYIYLFLNSRKDEHSSWTLQKKKKTFYLRHLLWS
jgi:hypothetical protein